MDFDRIKQNLRFRSGRTPRNLSKRFPTKEPEPAAREASIQLQQAPKATTRTQSTQKPPKLATNKKAPGGMPPTPHPTSPASRNPKLEHNTSDISTQATKNDPGLPNQIKTDHNFQSQTQQASGSDSGDADYDLRPAVSSRRPGESLEILSELLYSPEYLQSLISNTENLGRFVAFLQKYKPAISKLVLHYLETQKVIKAVDYANAVAASLSHAEVFEKENVANISASFRESSEDAFERLLNDALPAWVTYCLVKTSNICLTAEITGKSTPLTQNLVGGISEVFCLTDPNQPDNPIVYATQEFYRLTGYGKDNVIGYNCRFLQGPKTNRDSVQRLKNAIQKGEEVCEALLNYRRDGKPFLNILMLAPLLDDKGMIKYYLGAQVDASRLIDGGRGVDGFERFLTKRGMNKSQKSSYSNPKEFALSKLRDLSMSFDLEESAVVQTNSQNSSRNSERDDGSAAATDQQTQGRRRIQDDEDSGSESEHVEESDEEKENPAWKLSHEIPSGRLPGIYQKYILIRPYPSLRVIFASPSAKKMGKIEQHPFLAHLAAPPSTIAGLNESFKSETPVTAKIAIMSQAGATRTGTVTKRWGSKDGPSSRGEVCWISATPLLDSGDRVGVWMVVIVDKIALASHTQRTINSLARREMEIQEKPIHLASEDLPIKPTLVGQLDQEETLDATGEEAKAGRLDGITVNAPSPVANGLSTESPNGSPITVRALTLKSPDDISEDQEANEDSSRTPPNTTSDTLSDISPRQTQGSVRTLESSGARDVGLRAMDYLTSRSTSMSQTRRPSGSEQGGERTDWDLSSPYSVD